MALFHFFSAPENGCGSALLNWSSKPVEDILAYAASYRRSAMALAAFVEQRQQVTVDFGALPIVYLYRHAFELYLKAVIYHAAALSVNSNEMQRAVPRLWREHSLVLLSRMAEPILRAEDNPLTASGELYEEIASLANRIDEVDSGSYSFRYPVTSTGAPALPDAILINVLAFTDAMEAVLGEVAHFCGGLQAQSRTTVEQMKLALHPLTQG
jgi:hypothetical protein